MMAQSIFKLGLPNTILYANAMLTIKKSSIIMACLDDCLAIIGKVMIHSIKIASLEKPTKGELSFEVIFG